MRRGLIPYLLTGLLTLGAGLGAGLGIAATSTAARHSSAVGPEVSCVTVAPPNEALSCTSARSDAITEMVLSFPEVKLPGTFDNCVTNAMERVADEAGYNAPSTARDDVIRRPWPLRSARQDGREGHSGLWGSERPVLTRDLLIVAWSGDTPVSPARYSSLTCANVAGEACPERDLNPHVLSNNGF